MKLAELTAQLEQGKQQEESLISANKRLLGEITKLQDYVGKLEALNSSTMTQSKLGGSIASKYL